jgi:hypothetical protein
MTPELLAVLALWGFLGAVGWIVSTVTSNRGRQQIAARQAEMQAKLLDKLASSQDLAEYLKTDAGQRLLSAASMVGQSRTPLGRILGSIQAGVILTLLGVTVVFLDGAVGGFDGGLLLLGTMAAAVGVGFLVSAGIAFTLSKSYGLIEKKGERRA